MLWENRYFLFRDTTSLLVLALSESLRPKYGTQYLFTSANPKHTLPSDVILRRTTFFQPILPPSGPCNAPWFSSETLALYKFLTYLLTYLIICLSSASMFCSRQMSDWQEWVMTSERDPFFWKWVTLFLPSSTQVTIQTSKKDNWKSTFRLQYTRMNIVRSRRLIHTFSFSNDWKKYYLCWIPHYRNCHTRDRVYRAFVPHL